MGDPSFLETLLDPEGQYGSLSAGPPSRLAAAAALGLLPTCLAPTLVQAYSPAKSHQPWIL